MRSAILFIFKEAFDHLRAFWFVLLLFVLAFSYAWFPLENINYTNEALRWLDLNICFPILPVLTSIIFQTPRSLNSSHFHYALLVLG